MRPRTDIATYTPPPSTTCFCTLNRPHPLPAFLLVSLGPSPVYSRINITAPESPTTLHTSAYEDGTDRRFRNVGIYKPDAGELS